jgi:hypothetical protein
MARAGDDRVVAAGRKGRDPVVPPRHSASTLDRYSGGVGVALVDAPRQDGERRVAEGRVASVELAAVDVRLVPAGGKAGEFRLLRFPHARKRLLMGDGAAKDVIGRVRIAADSTQARASSERFPAPSSRQASSKAIPLRSAAGSRRAFLEAGPRARAFRSEGGVNQNRPSDFVRAT